MAGAGAGPSSKREYRKYEDKIRVLREAAACDETQQVLEEARQVTQRPTTTSLAPGPRLQPSISLPDFNRALTHHSGGGVMVRPRSPGASSPYSRSTSTSPVRSPSPKVVTLRHRDPFRLPGGSGNMLQIPNSRQRSKSDSNVSYAESSCTPEVVVLGVVGVLDTNINTKTYTSPQENLIPPTRIRVIQRSPSPSRRNTVAGNILSPSDFDPDLARYEQKKRSLPVGYQLCPEIIISDHDTATTSRSETHRTAYCNPDTPESDQSSQSGDLFQEVLGELDTPLDGMMDPGSVNAFFENLKINSNQTENQSSNLTTLTSPPCFNFEAPSDLTKQGECSISPTFHCNEFVVNNPVSIEQSVPTTTNSDGLEAEIMRFLQDVSK